MISEFAVVVSPEKLGGLECLLIGSIVPTVPSEADNPPLFGLTPLNVLSAMNMPSTSSISRTFEAVGCSKIFPAIVINNSIGVVHELWRPLASHVKPREPMGLVSIGANTNYDVPVVIVGARYQALDLHGSSIYKPSKVSRFRGVMKQLFKSCLCNFHNYLARSCADEYALYHRRAL